MKTIIIPYSNLGTNIFIPVVRIVDWCHSQGLTRDKNYD
jgi:hypothetical protein